jgi:hypothetical protein
MFNLHVVHDVTISLSITNDVKEVGMTTRVTVVQEARRPVEPSGWQLCFQWVLYTYDVETPKPSRQFGYRFIWRYPPNGNLQPARGQARLPSIGEIEKLLQMAKDAGWGDNHSEDKEAAE